MKIVPAIIVGISVRKIYSSWMNARNGARKMNAIEILRSFLRKYGL